MGGWNNDLNIFQNFFLFIVSPFIKIGEAIERKKYDSDGDRIRKHNERLKK